MTTSLDPAPLDPTPPSPDSGRAPSRTGLFRAVWRWHFFASFLVVPVLLLLATTGLIYLFRFQLEPLMHVAVALGANARAAAPLVPQTGFGSRGSGISIHKPT